MQYSFRLTITLLLCAAVARPSVCRQRTFLYVKKSEITCPDSKDNSTVNECNADDCFLLEDSGDANYTQFSLPGSLRSEEWNQMITAMQDLVTQDKMDDSYSGISMPILQPKSRLRQRVCPVRYSHDINADRVPAIIMHADCLNSDCGSNKNCECQPVEQYRKVYQLVSNCRVKDTDHGGDRVFVRKFINVTVNCAAVRLSI